MRWILLFAALLIAACHKDQPPAPTAEQSAQLNEAEDMLNAEAANTTATNLSGQSNTAQ